MLYGINCHVLTWLYHRNRKTSQLLDQQVLRDFYGEKLPNDAALNQMAHRLPVVTTQLPVYNERNVVERLIDAVAAFRYPAGRHEIQVLDDSTDETRRIVAAKVAQLKKRGVDIHHIIRHHRTGYKAGALREGMTKARGDFTAIFDADFLPPSDFLLRAMPFFTADEHLGFVQGRWGHLNRRESLITRLQAIGIDGHFMVEQSARSGSGLYLNFNGTAGIFRNLAIVDAGNWQDDTLTEDMDLSYRIQLAGWGCRFVSDLVAPAEIPNDVNAFKNQQFRWAKGSIQTALKLLPRILRTRRRPFVKFQAVMHLTHYMVHPLMLFMAITALPILLAGGLSLQPMIFSLFVGLLAVSFTGPSRLYLTAEWALGINRRKALLLLPIMIPFGCGLAINNSRAVFEALLGRQSGFVRTPKRGHLRAKVYAIGQNRFFLLEMAASIWCLVGALAFFLSRVYLVGPFLLIYTIGFCFIGMLSWRHMNPKVV